MSITDRAENRGAVRVVAACAVAVLLVSGTALVAGASTSGVGCSAGTSSITVSWYGEFRAYQYTAWVRNSAGTETRKIVDWSGRTTGYASAEFTDLSAGAYTVGVTMQTVDGSWIGIGEASCTVATTDTTATTAAPAATTTTTPAGSAGSLSCSATSSSLEVTLNPADGTTGWEVWAEFSLGYPRLGQFIPVVDGTDEELTHEFTSVAQGTWSVTGTAFFDGSHSTLAGVSCTVAGGL